MEKYCTKGEAKEMAELNINMNAVRIEEYRARKQIAERDAQMATGEKYNVYNKLERLNDQNQLAEEFMD